MQNSSNLMLNLNLTQLLPKRIVNNLEALKTMFNVSFHTVKSKDPKQRVFNVMGTDANLREFLSKFVLVNDKVEGTQKDVMIDTYMQYATAV